MILDNGRIRCYIISVREKEVKGHIAPQIKKERTYIL
jgi:hypothetical protein